MSDCYILKSEILIHGYCLVDVYKSPGDLNDGWDIVALEGDEFPRLPDARYGVNCPEYDEYTRYLSGYTTEHFKRWDLNGHTYEETIIRVDGKIVAIG
jgi:hypothetical protein